MAFPGARPADATRPTRRFPGSAPPQAPVASDRSAEPEDRPGLAGAWVAGTFVGPRGNPAPSRDTSGGLNAPPVEAPFRPHGSAPRGSTPAMVSSTVTARASVRGRAGPVNSAALCTAPGGAVAADEGGVGAARSSVDRRVRSR